MDKKDKKIMEDNNRLFKKIFKSILYTLIIFFLSIWGIYGIVSLGFGEMSVEQSNTWGIISLGIGIIFTVFYCTFTILEELKNTKQS